MARNLSSPTFSIEALLRGVSSLLEEDDPQVESRLGSLLDEADQAGDLDGRLSHEEWEEALVTPLGQDLFGSDSLAESTRSQIFYYINQRFSEKPSPRVSASTETEPVSSSSPEIQLTGNSLRDDPEVNSLGVELIDLYLAGAETEPDEARRFEYLNSAMILATQAEDVLRVDAVAEQAAELNHTGNRETLLAMQSLFSLDREGTYAHLRAAGDHPIARQILTELEKEDNAHRTSMTAAVCWMVVDDFLREGQNFSNSWLGVAEDYWMDKLGAEGESAEEKVARITPLLEEFFNQWVTLSGTGRYAGSQAIFDEIVSKGGDAALGYDIFQHVNLGYYHGYAVQDFIESESMADNQQRIQKILDSADSNLLTNGKAYQAAYGIAELLSNEPAARTRAEQVMRHAGSNPTFDMVTDVFCPENPLELVAEIGLIRGAFAASKLARLKAFGDVAGKSRRVRAAAAALELGTEAGVFTIGGAGLASLTNDPREIWTTGNLGRQFASNVIIFGTMKGMSSLARPAQKAMGQSRVFRDPAGQTTVDFPTGSRLPKLNPTGVATLGVVGNLLSANGMALGEMGAEALGLSAPPPNDPGYLERLMIAEITILKLHVAGRGINMAVGERADPARYVQGKEIEARTRRIAVLLEGKGIRASTAEGRELLSGIMQAHLQGKISLSEIEAEIARLKPVSSAEAEQGTKPSGIEAEREPITISQLFLQTGAAFAPIDYSSRQEVETAFELASDMLQTESAIIDNRPLIVDLMVYRGNLATADLVQLQTWCRQIIKDYPNLAGFKIVILDLTGSPPSTVVTDFTNPDYQPGAKPLKAKEPARKLMESPPPPPPPPVPQSDAIPYIPRPTPIPLRDLRARENPPLQEQPVKAGESADAFNEKTPDGKPEPPDDGSGKGGGTIDPLRVIAREPVKQDVTTASWNDLGIPREHIEALYAEHKSLPEEERLEHGLHGLSEGTGVVSSGERMRTDSVILEAGDESGDGMVRPSEFKAHIHGGDPVPSRGDLKILSARARLNQGVPQIHTVFGYSDGQRAFIQITVLFNGTETHFSFKISENLPKTIDHQLDQKVLQVEQEIGGLSQTDLEQLAIDRAAQTPEEQVAYYEEGLSGLADQRAVDALKRTVVNPADRARIMEEWYNLWFEYVFEKHPDLAEALNKFEHDLFTETNSREVKTYKKEMRAFVDSCKFLFEEVGLSESEVNNVMKGTYGPWASFVNGCRVFMKLGLTGGEVKTVMQNPADRDIAGLATRIERLGGMAISLHPLLVRESRDPATNQFLPRLYREQARLLNDTVTVVSRFGDQAFVDEFLRINQHHIINGRLDDHSKRALLKASLNDPLFIAKGLDSFIAKLTVLPGISEGAKNYLTGLRMGLARGSATHQQQAMDLFLVRDFVGRQLFGRILANPNCDGKFLVSFMRESATALKNNKNTPPDFLKNVFENTAQTTDTTKVGLLDGYLFELQSFNLLVNHGRLTAAPSSGYLRPDQLPPGIEHETRDPGNADIIGVTYTDPAGGRAPTSGLDMDLILPGGPPLNYVEIKRTVKRDDIAQQRQRAKIRKATELGLVSKPGCITSEIDPGLARELITNGTFEYIIVMQEDPRSGVYGVLHVYGSNPRIGRTSVVGGSSAGRFGSTFPVPPHSTASVFPFLL